MVKLPRIPKPGETLLGKDLVTAAGGKGANQAVAAARAGGAVTFVARVGQDALGEKAVVGFMKEGINVDHVHRDKTSPSGVALIFVAANGENSIAAAQGANAKLSLADLRKAKSTLAQADVLVMQLETPLEVTLAAAELAAKAGIPVILNPAPAPTGKLPDELLKRVSILTPNETEAEVLTGVKVSSEAGAAKAADKLLAKGVQTVIITLGRRGALLASQSGKRLIPSFQVQALDTTAAGDTFNGTLAVALAEGKSVEDAVRFANAAAALSVTRLGAQTSAPSRKEIEKFLKLHPAQ